MSQIFGFIPSARTLWLLGGGGLVSTTIAVFMPTNQGIAIAALLTFSWYVAILILASIDASRVIADRVQVSRAELGKLSIGRDNPVTLTIKAGQNQRKSQLSNYQIRDGVPPDLPGTPELIYGRL